MDNKCNREIFEGLNPAQYKAVENIDGPTLIVAGAGSGKTRVLTCRIANIIDHDVPPYRVLALTFTKKAAEEMKGRISVLVGEQRARHIWMGTFHSVFIKFLRMYADQLGYPPQFTIYDENDTKSAIRKCLKELELDEKVYKPGFVASRISMAKNNLLTAASYANNSLWQEEDRNARCPRLHQVYSLYAQRCKEAGAMDFDDILLETNILLRDHPEALQHLKDKFSYILVDEYQDTNYSQYLILKKLAADHRNICVVGDDSQSIYAFRGARVENILYFQKDYPDAQVIRLEQNYRSTKNIVNAANSLIAKNKNRLPKECFSCGDEGSRLHLVNAGTDFEEGFSIATSIKSFIYRDHAQYSDFAVLYRTNAQSRVIEEALRKFNLPYRVLSGLSFYDRAEVKDMVAYFRLVTNPLDNEAFKRIINLPARGIGATSIGYLEAAANAAHMSLMETIMGPDNDLLAAGLRMPAIVKMREFAKMIFELNEVVGQTDAFETATAIGNRSGLLAVLKNSNEKEDHDRLDVIQELLNGIKEFCEEEAEVRREMSDVPGEDMVSSGDVITLSDYIENFTLLSSAEIREGEDKDAATNKISLMTVHASKGLEFPYVYIAGMEEELFPSGRDMLPTDIEEERRLFYVALTRAMKEVTLSFASMRHRYGKEEYNSVSRFLREIDRKYLDGNIPDDDPFGFESGSGFDAGHGTGSSHGTGNGGFGGRQADRPGSTWGSNGRPTFIQRDGARQQPGSRPDPQQHPGQRQSQYQGSTQRQGASGPQRPSSQSTAGRDGGRPIQRVSAPAPARSAIRSTTVANFTPDNPEKIRTGMRVEHNIFGPGQIISMEGTGANAKAVLRLDSGESKTLLLKYAKLRIIED